MWGVHTGERVIILRCKKPILTLLLPLHHVSLGLLDDFRQVAVLVFFDHDVAASDKLTRDVQLRDGRPVAAKQSLCVFASRFVSV